MLDRGERIMGFGHRVYRAEDPRARVLRRTAQELGSERVEVAEALEEAALAALREKSPDRVLETNVEFWAAVVLEIADIPPTDVPADVRLRARRRLVGAHHRAEAHRAADPPVARATSARRSHHADRVALDHARRRCRQANALAEQGSERELADLRAKWGEELDFAARSSDYRERVVAYRAIGQFRFRAEDRAAPPRPRGREPGVPRLGAPLARAAVARPSGRRERVRPLLHELATRDGNQAVRRLAIMALRNGSAQRDTIRSSPRSATTTSRTASCARRRRRSRSSCAARRSSRASHVATTQLQWCEAA